MPNPRSSMRLVIPVPPFFRVLRNPKQLVGLERFDVSVTEDHVKQPVVAVRLVGKRRHSLRRLRVPLIPREIEMAEEIPWKWRTRATGRCRYAGQDHIPESNHVT